jgi:transcriptional regulator GlxA family with amidase domain
MVPYITAMQPHRIAILAFDYVVDLDLAIPVQIFGPGRRPRYQTAVCGTADHVTTASGLRVATPRGLADLASADTVIVPGYIPYQPPPAREVLDLLVAAYDRGARVASICTGAFALAAAGLLDGRPATTHWTAIDELRAGYPTVRIQPNVLFVDDGRVATSAGMCCGIDLCLHLIRTDHGAGYANSVARDIVAPPRRSGGQAQFVPAPAARTDDRSLAATRTWALANLAAPLTARDLARHAGLAERTFARRFKAEAGTTALQWILDARIDAARELLESTDLSLAAISARTGFGTPDNLRIRFRQRLGTTPSQYRATFRLT